MTDEDGDAPSEPPTSMRSRLTTALSPRRAASVSPDPRAAMKTLDATERKWGVAALVILLASALAYVPHVLHDTHITQTAAKVGKVCPAHYELVKDVCTQYLTYHPSDYWPYFAISMSLGVLLALGLLRSLRTLSVFTAFLGGLAVGSVSPISTLGAMGWGAWVLVRSWRQSRYGAKDAKTARTVSKERYEEKREAKKRAPAAAAASSTTPSGRAVVEPSRRYTPKSKPRRR